MNIGSKDFFSGKIVLLAVAAVVLVNAFTCVYCMKGAQNSSQPSGAEKKKVTILIPKKKKKVEKKVEKKTDEKKEIKTVTVLIKRKKKKTTGKKEALTEGEIEEVERMLAEAIAEELSLGMSEETEEEKETKEAIKAEEAELRLKREVEAMLREDGVTL